MKIKKYAFISILIFSSLLMGCSKKISSSEPVNSSSSNPSSLPLNENQDNFVQSNKIVTNTKLVAYDGPSFLNQYEGVNIKVNNEDLFVYKTRVNHKRMFSWDVPDTYAPLSIFDFEGKVHVDIKIKDTSIKSVKISPMIYNIKPTINNDVISFDLDYADNYVVSYNDDDNNAIHLFASPIEENPITEEDAKKDSSIIYIGPGVYKADAIPLKSNSTLYLAGGSYVYGQIRTEGLENITIRGRGIISGAIYNRRSQSEYTIPVEIRTSKNVIIEDITFLDPAGWTIALYKSSNIHLNNVKIISSRQNSDGISVQSCSDVYVNKGFIRTWDDSLVVKNVDRGTTSNINFDGVYVWTDLAQSMEVGYETYGATMDNINFNNITVIHNYHKAAISLHNCDDANITNVHYKNITIEDASMLGDNQQDGENDFLIDFTIAYNIDWTKSEGKRGKVSDIDIENVKVYNMKDSIISRMLGESNDSIISNVNIKNVEINGQSIKKLKDLNIATNDYVKDVKYTLTDNKIIGAKINLPYKNELINEDVEHIKEKNIEQDGLLVPSFAKSTSELSYIGEASKINQEIKATHSQGNKTSTPSDDGSGDFSLENHGVENLTDNNLKTTWKSKNWLNQDNEFTCLTIEFDQVIKIGVIRIYGYEDNSLYYTYAIQVWGKKVKSDGSINDKYTRLQGTKNYEMTPGKNNIIDINITTQEYKGIQLRLYRLDDETGCKNYEISKIDFYPPSLSYNKAIVDSTEHSDVYNVEKLVDGDPTGTSYYESKGLPAHIVIDLGDIYTVNTFVLSLPPSLLWDARVQNIELLSSNYNLSYEKEKVQFTQLVKPTDYTFDPSLGNRIIVKINPTQMRYVKILINSNSNVGGYGGQLSEFSVYGY